VFKVGEMVRWMCPLEEDYSYGTILEIKQSKAKILCTGYYAGMITEVHLRYIDKLERGGEGFGRGKKCSKRSVT
jgi:hypothetical protein